MELQKRGTSSPPDRAAKRARQQSSSSGDLNPVDLVYVLVLEKTSENPPEAKVLFEINSFPQRNDPSTIITIGGLANAVVHRVEQFYSNISFVGEPKVFARDPRIGGNINDKLGLPAKKINQKVATLSAINPIPVDRRGNPAKPYFVLLTPAVAPPANSQGKCV